MNAQQFAEQAEQRIALGFRRHLEAAARQLQRAFAAVKFGLALRGTQVSLGGAAGAGAIEVFGVQHRVAFAVPFGRRQVHLVALGIQQ